MSHGNKVEKTITITGYERPELFEEAIKHLIANDMRGWHLFVRIEPSPKQEQFAKTCANYIPDEQLDFKINDERLGVCKNPFFCIESAFKAGSQFNLNIEEDIYLAPDALNLCNWYIENQKDYWFGLNLLAGPGGVDSNISRPEYPKALVEMKALNALGLGINREKWQDIARHVWEAEFTKTENKFRQYGINAWDWALYRYIHFSDYFMLHPLSARSNHLGAEGTHCTKDFQEQAFDRVPLNASIETEFEVLKGEAVAQDVAAHIRAHEQIGRLIFEKNKGKKKKQPFKRLLIRLKNSFLKRIGKF